MGQMIYCTHGDNIPDCVPPCTINFISGDPPSFTSPTEPQDQFVFERDDDGNPVNLTFLCPVSGNPQPSVTWSVNITYTPPQIAIYTLTYIIL